MQPNATPGVPRWIAPTAVSLAGVWAAGVTAVGQVGGWGVEEVLTATGYEVPGAYWPLLSVVVALVAGGPAALAWVLVKRPVLRGIARSWTFAAGCAAVLGLVRVVPWSFGDTSTSVLFAVVALGLVFVVRGGVSGGEPARPRVGGIGVLASLAVGLLVLLPWWWVGALGSPLDAVAALLAALALGALASRLRRIGPVRVPVGGPVAGLVLDALVVAVPLTLLAGAFGTPGLQVLLLGVLPAAGLALAVTEPRGRWAGLLLVAACAYGPLGFADAEEISVLLIPGDVPRWAAVATGVSAWLALVAGAVAAIVLVLRTRRTVPVVAARGRGRVLAGLAVAVVVLASATVWVGPGRAGFFGDRLFVVLSSQADLTAVANTTDLTARRRAVYDRLVEHARRTQAPLLSALRKAGADPTPFYLVNAIEVDDTPVVRAVLAARDDVASVRPNPELRPIPELAGPGAASDETPTGPPANLLTIKAPEAWADGVDGRGVTVGFSDSGVDVTHPTLRPGYRGGADSWYDPWFSTTTPTDPNGHGTHTAASAVGKTVGVAPGATWIGCANLARPLGNPAYYLGCLQFMLAPFRTGGDPFTDGDPARAADVLSNSWGCPDLEGCGANTLEPATNALRAAGIFVVAAAGNSGPRCRTITDPIGRYDSVFTVGAVDDKKEIASFSSRGPVPSDSEAKPDLVAPGVDVLSAWPGGGYARLSGTSMATPQVAGVVALVWQAAPSLRGDVTRTAALLRASAQDASLGGTSACGGSERNVLGAGEVDASAAVTLARQTTATRPR
ncbi:S8 family serine peptidase [Cryptosporangium phraense]|uniref:S8 family serine peptidase n=1 Tax=Cryptosporangium phraense TaxID=2593070 RepID=A0A545APE6_9ACTN|nr:S8 family serine peptidase [Cryptosporangium phraense]TQS43197.1 S8 family serine peptidase [Cryptosporangium phraense]